MFRIDILWRTSLDQPTWLMTPSDDPSISQDREYEELEVVQRNCAYRRKKRGVALTDCIDRRGVLRPRAEESPYLKKEFKSVSPATASPNFFDV